MVMGKYKPVEHLKGVGEVYEGNKKLARVSYELDIERIILTVEDFQGSEEVEGGQSRTGSIKVLEGQIGLLDTGKMLILHLADGRKVEFRTTDGDIKTGCFPIELSGHFY
jgi:hypothetical protein